MSALSLFGKLDRYESLDGAVKIDKNNLYLLGQLVATNLRDCIAINLYADFTHQLNRLEGVQLERYGNSVWLNGQPLHEEDLGCWLIVRKATGEWYKDIDVEELIPYNMDYDYDRDYSDWLEGQRE